MYLEEATVQSLLAAAAGMSPEGTAFVGISITQPVLDRLRAKQRPPAVVTGDSQGLSLLDSWVFACPQDPTQVGWLVLPGVACMYSACTVSVEEDAWVAAADRSVAQLRQRMH